MKIKRLRLENVRSYDDQTVEFPDGVILVHGENGSGKTSLLMGIFGGLFLSKITSVGSNSFTLEDLVRRGEDSACVELVFEVGGTAYTTEWRLHRTSTASTAELTSSALSNPVTGVRDVRAAVVQLVGLDAEDFASSVYVKQGEVDRLIDDEDRTTTIDSLLGLDEIDNHTERMKQARRAAGRVREANAERRRGHQEDRDEYDRDEADFQREITALTDDIEAAEGDVETAEEYLGRLKDHRREKTAALDRYEDLVEKARAKAEQVERVEAKRGEQQSAIEDAESAIEDAEDEIERIEAEIADLGEGVEYDLGDEESAEAAREGVTAALTEASAERATAESKLESAREEHERLVDEREAATETLDELTDERESLRERYESIEERAEAAESAIEEAIGKRDRRAASFLPKPEAADVTDEHREAVGERLDTLCEKREAATNALTEARTKREVKASALEEARAELADLEERLDSLGEQRTTICEEIEAAKAEVEAAEGELAERVENLASDGDELGIAVSIESLGEARNDHLPARRDELTDALGDAKSAIAALNTEERQYTEDLDELRNLGEGGTCPTCGQAVSEAHVEDEIAELEDELADMRERKAAKESEREAIAAERADLDGLRERITETIEYRDDALEARREKLDDLCERESDIDAEVAETSGEADAMGEEIARIEGQLDDFDERIAALETDESEAREGVSTGEAVIEGFETVAERREALEVAETEREDVVDDIRDIENDIEEKQSEVESLDGALDSQRGTVENRETALAEARERVEAVEEAKSTVEGAVERYDTIDDHEATISRATQRIAGAERAIEDFNEQLATLDRELAKVEEELDEHDGRDEIEAEIRETEARIEKREATREEYATRVRRLRDERSKLEIERDNLERLNERIERCERKERWADDVYQEIEMVLSVYQRVKSELREEYLAYINEYTNEVFGKIYKNTGYQQVQIEEIHNERRETYDYAIRLLRDDGARENPTNASGGERAIVNLALRAGIYRLIAEMGGGDRSTLPPFILDEPTTFLDEGHVGQLERMLRTLDDWDVPQVIVVSHDERLIHGADHECAVRKDAATKTSRAEMHVAGQSRGADGGDVGVASGGDD
ncbi:AAA family ATPase [Halococcus salifodinae]|uniref:SMC domain-containing protein n=1 Tax=Halococcus salifodinae DSM 8989 TaxID=1227456 RepID=M0MYP5_9EURY|nr:AAA family ATPase [Halococcus salifodinae]EMA50731.1 SMC domain-containing protein [Halococcus salifodinae DSM 8989]